MGKAERYFWCLGGPTRVQDTAAPVHLSLSDFDESFCPPTALCHGHCHCPCLLPAGPRSPRKDRVQLLSVGGLTGPGGACSVELAGYKAPLERGGGGSRPLSPACAQLREVTKPVRPPACSRLASPRGLQTGPALRLRSGLAAGCLGDVGPVRVAPGRFTEAGLGTEWGSGWLSLNERWLVSDAESGGAGSGSPGDSPEAGRAPSLTSRLHVGERHPLGPQSTLIEQLGGPERMGSGDAAVAKGIESRPVCPWPPGLRLL